MPNQKPIIPITVLITIVVVAILMVGVAWWYKSNQAEEKASCSSIKNYNTCKARTDCMPIDSCECNNVFLQAEKCGLSTAGRCLCASDFQRCEKFTCPTPNTNAGTTACADYIIDEEYKITDTSKQPQGTWAEMKSPNDNSTLEVIVLDPDDPVMLDESWRYAYYSQTENIFWIADMPGEFFGGWYGPFKEKPCSTCDEELCSQFRYGSCPSYCEKRCLPSQCSDTPTGRVCTTDCEGQGSCACPSSQSINTNMATNSKTCTQDSDCGLLVCMGCYSQEYLKTAPPDLPCREYDGYICQCVKNRCIEVKPDKPYDFPSIRSEADCLALGAEWVSVGKMMRCEIPTPDEGKDCTKASDCIRYCSLKNVNDATGTCSAHSGSGCYRFLDEDGKFGMICVD